GVRGDDANPVAPARTRSRPGARPLGAHADALAARLDDAVLLGVPVAVPWPLRLPPPPSIRVVRLVGGTAREAPGHRLVAEVARLRLEVRAAEAHVAVVGR